MASSVPAFVAAFVAALASPMAAAGAKVHDGPPMTDLELDYCAVGYSGDGGAAVDGRQAAITLQYGRIDEFTVNCQIGAASGDGDAQAARARAFALFEVAAGVLAGDWTVDETVTFAELDTYALHIDQTTNAATAQIDFAVAVRITPL